MNGFLSRTRGVGAWVWKRASAAIAVLLIVGALIVGYLIGRPVSGPGDSAGEASESGGSRAAERMYTCSMHPSVRLPDSEAKCPICFMDLIPVSDGGGGSGSGRRIAMSEEAAALSRIETAPVARFFPTAEARLYGKVVYDETSVARLTAYFPGRIERLFVNYVGVRVGEGEHIAEVYSPELLSAFEELRQAARAVAAAGAEATSEIVRSSTADTLVAAREKLRLYGLTEGQISDVERGVIDSDRVTVFSPLGGVVTDLAVREGDYVDEGSAIGTVADLSRLWLDLEAYESQLPMLRWGQRVSFRVESRPGEVFDGRVSFIEPMVDERTRTAAVRVAVDNGDRRLKPGMFASAVVRVRMGAGGAVSGGELAGRWVGPMHPTVVKDEPGRCDICGMDLVPAESLGAVDDAADGAEPLVVPRSAVLFTGTRSVVYIEVPGADRPTYEAREVVVGPRAGEHLIVRDGLREGERVVVHGAFRVDSAMQIAGKRSMMMPGDDAGGGPSRFEVSDAFVQSLEPVYAAYLDAQESLASDDMSGFTRAAGALNRAVASVERARLVGEPLAAWRRVAAKLRLEDIPADIAAARERFERLSDGVIALEERFGHAVSERRYVAYCPMAFGNAGAVWVQRGERINNPYFGASMLRCGEIRRSLPPLDSASGRGEGETDGG